MPIYANMLGLKKKPSVGCLFIMPNITYLWPFAPLLSIKDYLRHLKILLTPVTIKM